MLLNHKLIAHHINNTHEKQGNITADLSVFNISLSILVFHISGCRYLVEFCACGFQYSLNALLLFF